MNHTQPADALSPRVTASEPKSSRRALVLGLLSLPAAPALFARWWSSASAEVVIRNGWVLSKDD